ncbi:MAG: tRNA pseudouridine(38-40) synthase TruA [Campylobacter sp.]|nr:tRNA pseudouridine(38-40) synthase TruA [Campylobacter sp.]
MNIKITYSYDGSSFSGSQTQPHTNTVEDELKKALKNVGIVDKLITSSRTDKNVHALNQVSTVEVKDFWDLNRLKTLINRKIHPSIFIKNISETRPNFHPRYDAKARSYRYILNHATYLPFLKNYCYFYEEVDLEKLNLALSKFKGKHNFINFMKTGSDVRTTKREIYTVFAYRYKNLTIIKFKASGFLRAQVRLMVANALKEVSFDKEFSINAPNSHTPAPPNGLYLERIFY